VNFDHLTKKKARLDALRPLPSAQLDNLENWFRVELTYTSNAIEGNTLTRAETALVVEKGLTVGGKTLVEHLEASNHVAALDWVREQVKQSPRSLSQRDVLTIHEMILHGIDEANSGRYRNIAVRISGSMVVLPNPRQVPDLMDEFERWLVGSLDTLHPVEHAADAHYRLVTIHPFVDGNGRTARLLMNMILIMHGYPPAIIRPRDRITYLNALEKGQTGGSKDDYFRLIAKAVDRSLDIYLNAAANEEIEPTGDTSSPLLTIGKLAKETGTVNSTIRHWVKAGLLEVAEITPAGYQLFERTTIDRIRRIRDLQAKRMTLAEIRTAMDVE
jgi:Fic family protein